MNTPLIKFCIIIVSSISCWGLPLNLLAQPKPIWPISSVPAPNGDPVNWNRVNCTLGEIHGSMNNPHFHGAIDIDHDTPNCPMRLVQPGMVVDKGALSPIGSCKMPNWYVEVEHEYPPGSGNRFRKTRYLHLNADDVQAFPINQNMSYPTGEPLVRIVNGCGGNGHHLHFEMWEFIDGRWIKLNPLGNNTTDWALRYHQELEGHEDTYDPEINDVYFAEEPGETAPGQQSNGVFSGFYSDPETAVGLSKRVVEGTTYCRAHLATTQFSDFSTGPIVQYPHD